MVSLVLAGCSAEQAIEQAIEPAVEPAVDQPAAAEPEVSTEFASEPEAAGTATANGSPPGTFEVTSADGSVAISVVNGDATYTLSTADATLLAEGTWAVTDGNTCFSPTTEGVEAICFTDTAPAADGSFTGTPDMGEPVTVRPVPAN